MLPLIQHQSDDRALVEVLTLILDNFAYMDSRIDPPSSILQSTVDDLSKQCEIGEVWSIGSPAVACVCLTPSKQSLNVGRLAVVSCHRGQGLGGRLMALAEKRALHHGLAFLELKVRVELNENIRLYRYLGFEMTEEGTHAGFDRPTYWVMRKSLPAVKAKDSEL